MSQRIAEGTYKGRGIKGSEQYGETKGGYSQIVLNIELTDIGEQVSTFLIFSDKSAPYSMKRLRALGWRGDDITNLDGIDSNDVDVHVYYDEYEGKQQMKVDIVVGGTVTLDRQFDDKQKKAFAARFKDLAKSIAPGPVAVRSTPASPAATGTDDSIPF